MISTEVIFTAALFTSLFMPIYLMMENNKKSWVTMTITQRDQRPYKQTT